jgi:ABC-type transport system involved in cytochrome c biogenesis permease subunit
MQEMSVFWLRAAAALYSLGLLHAIVTVLSRQDRFFAWSLRAFSVAATFHFVSIAERWLGSGQFPASNFFESASLCAFLIAVSFLFLHWRYEFDSLGVFLFPLVFLMTLLGTLDAPVAALSSPNVRSAWLLAHVVLVMLGYAALLVTATASVFYLIEERRLKKKISSKLFDHLPPLLTLDGLITRAMGLGFTLITIATVLGITWAQTEGRPNWIAEPRVVISLLTWALCLVMVFLRTSAGWRGRKAATMALVILGCSALTWAAKVVLKPAVGP